MRPADSWKDYELLDATGGNRLERWGETILIRPDPQVVWKTEKQSPLWAKADAIYHRSNQGGGEWEYRRRLPGLMSAPGYFFRSSFVFALLWQMMSLSPSMMYLPSQG